MQDIIDDILRREGGYVWNANDRGGPTNYGITQATLSSYRGKPVTDAEVRLLSENEARTIYFKRFITGPKFDLIADELLRRAVIDGGVNHGTSRAAGWLQTAAGGLKVDGVIGALSLAAINAKNPLQLRLRFMAARARYYGQLITRDRSQAVFAEGWLDRYADILEEV